MEEIQKTKMNKQKKIPILEFMIPCIHISTSAFFVNSSEFWNMDASKGTGLVLSPFFILTLVPSI